MPDAFAHLDATAQAQLVKSGDATPLELVDAAIARIEALDDRVGAVVTRLFDRARQQAASPDLPKGPFHGVPFLLKDLVSATAGDPLFKGNRALRDAGYTAPADTALARRFREAGLVTVGKSNTPELGFTVTTEPEAIGPSRNPWNLEHSTGGSSGGSAAAVAARLVPIAHANDGGGSIRVPASECGLVGLKPSRARVSLAPLGEDWHGLVAEGVVSLSVRDTAAALDAIAGPEPGDPYAAPHPQRPYREELAHGPEGLRIGLLRRRPGGDLAHADCVAAVEKTARLLQGLGHHVEESHPAALEEAELGEHFSAVVMAHAARNHEEIAELLKRRLGPDDFEAYTWSLMEHGRELSAARYIAACDWLQTWTRRVASWWADGFDLLLTPTIAEPPPPLGTVSSAAGPPEEVLERVLGLIPFTPAYNVTGQPAISLPLHWSESGLPVGVQLVAALGREDLLIAVAARLEEAQPWLERRPPLCA
ncbi:MAG: amidase family protein [Myxococcota bacterium]|nr:amidase family protein [Myxococcota bacterium]